MKKNCSNVYTPQINEESVIMLRRVAWAAEKPMIKSLNACIQNIVNNLDRKVVCSACKDHRCLECPISREARKSEIDCILL